MIKRYPSNARTRARWHSTSCCVCRSPYSQERTALVKSILGISSHVKRFGTTSRAQPAPPCRHEVTPNASQSQKRAGARSMGVLIAWTHQCNVSLSTTCNTFLSSMESAGDVLDLQKSASLSKSWIRPVAFIIFIKVPQPRGLLTAWQCSATG